MFSGHGSEDANGEVIGFTVTGVMVQTSFGKFISGQDGKALWRSMYGPTRPFLKIDTITQQI